MSFELFDPQSEVWITTGKLPHWYQPGVTYFVTFRTDDSFPVAVARQWYSERDNWLQQQGIDPRCEDWLTRLRSLPEVLRRRFHRVFSQEFMACLDKGLGECALKRPEIARIVADSLSRFDGERYSLGAYVVMPNHVHVLVGLLGDTAILEQCYSWKKFTATQINRELGRKGRFWHEESFDHLVRSPEQFEYLRAYIADNPRKAGLRSGEYFHWQRDDLQ